MNILKKTSSRVSAFVVLGLLLGCKSNKLEDEKLVNSEENPPSTDDKGNKNEGKEANNDDKDDSNPEDTNQGGIGDNGGGGNIGGGGGGGLKNPAQCSSWENIGSGSISTGSAGYLSLAIGSGGQIALAFADGDLGYKLSVKTFDSDWSFLGSSTISGSNVFEVKILSQQNGNFFVSFRDEANGGKGTVKTFSNNSWQTVGNAGFTPGVGVVSFTSFALSSVGVPYFSFRDEVGGIYALKYLGGAWSTLGGTTVGQSQVTQLFVSSSGEPNLVYGDPQGSIHKKFVNSSWQEVSSSSPPSPAAGSSVAYDPNGTPFFAFADSANGYKLSVKKFDGSNWIYVGNAGFTANSVFSPRIVFGSDGLPYVAFSDGATGNPGEGKVMRLMNGQWENFGPQNFTSPLAREVGFGFLPDQTPIFAYQDEDDGYRAKALKCLP
jgi:hypothetical protein